MSTRPTISAKSAGIIQHLDVFIRRHDIRGTIQTFSSVPSDALDGRFYYEELEDLIKRRFLDCVPTIGGERARWKPNPRVMCGTSFTVIATPRLARTFWPKRFSQ